MSEWKVHLEFEEDNSSKFWRARVEGKTLYVNFGRIGSAGQTQMKELGSPDAALKELEKLEREKRKKGYHDAGGGSDEDEAEDDDAADDEDEDAGEDDNADEDEEPAPRRGKAAAPITAALAMTSRGRKVEAKLVLEGTKLRVEADESYDSADKARAAFDRLKQALVDDGYKP